MKHLLNRFLSKITGFLKTTGAKNTKISQRKVKRRRDKKTYGFWGDVHDVSAGQKPLSGSLKSIWPACVEKSDEEEQKATWLDLFPSLHERMQQDWVRHHETYQDVEAVRRPNQVY